MEERSYVKSSISKYQQKLKKDLALKRKQRLSFKYWDKGFNNSDIEIGAHLQQLSMFRFTFI